MMQYQMEPMAGAPTPQSIWAGEVQMPGGTPASMAGLPGGSGAGPGWQPRQPGMDGAPMQPVGPGMSGTGEPGSMQPAGHGAAGLGAAPMQPAGHGMAGPAFGMGSSMRPVGPNQVQHVLPVEVVEAPATAGEAYLGSLKAMLSKNLGNYIVASFAAGNQNMVSWEGILCDVGNDYLTIYQDDRGRYIVSDFYSLKFMEIYDMGRGESRRNWADRQK